MKTKISLYRDRLVDNECWSLTDLEEDVPSIRVQLNQPGVGSARLGYFSTGYDYSYLNKSYVHQRQKPQKTHFPADTWMLPKNLSLSRLGFVVALPQLEDCQLKEINFVLSGVSILTYLVIIRFFI